MLLIPLHSACTCVCTLKRIYHINIHVGSCCSVAVVRCVTDLCSFAVGGGGGAAGCAATVGAVSSPATLLRRGHSSACVHAEGLPGRAFEVTCLSHDVQGLSLAIDLSAH